MEKDKAKARKQKKPFHIKKSDLDLDGYKQEIAQRSPSILFRNAISVLKTSRQFRIYVALQALAAVVGYGQVMLCIGVLWMFYVNTGKRKPGEKSAYSLFNRNVEALVIHIHKSSLTDLLSRYGLASTVLPTSSILIARCVDNFTDIFFFNFVWSILRWEDDGVGYRTAMSANISVLLLFMSNISYGSLVPAR